MRLRDLPDSLNEISGHVLNAAIKVHSALGPGLLESSYKTCLAHELATRGFTVAREVPLEVRYCDLVIERAYFADIIVDGVVLVEAKAVADLQPVHEAQMMTYLRWARLPLGLLLNFHVKRLTDGGFVRRAMRHETVPRGPPAPPATPRGSSLSE